jgi:methylase of polypeptide subunit release factors
LSGAFDSVYAYEDIFYHLEALLRKEREYGVDVARRSDYVAKGSGQTGKLLAFPLIVDLLNQKNLKKVLDLGCGDGSFLAHLCENNGHIKGYGLDISPEAIERGCSNLMQKALQHRAQLFVGDIFKIETMVDQLEGIEAGTAIYVLH